MSALYLTAKSDAIRTLRTARGHHWVKATLQSWDGSIGITLSRDGVVEILCGEGSTADPHRILWTGQLMDLLTATGLSVGGDK